MSTVNAKKRPPRIIVRPATVIFFLILLFLDRSMLTFIPVIAAILHEFGHLFVMQMLDVPVREMEITVFGAEIRAPKRSMGWAGKVMIYGAGAAANFISAAVIMLLPPMGYVADFFAACSVTLGAVNLLPVGTLDGGCILEVLLKKVMRKDADKVLYSVSAVTLFILWLAAVYILLVFDGNLSLMLFCMYLFVTLFLR